MRKALFFFALVLLTSMLTTRPATSGQALERGPARPVKPVSRPPTSRKDIEFASFDFQRSYFGREGPNYTEIDGEPSQATQYVVKAELFGQEAIASARFELLATSGSVLAVLHLTKLSHRLDDGEYEGLVAVPAQPFRVRVSGKDISGQPYQRVHKRLFRPTDEPPAGPSIPTGFPEDERQRATEMTRLDDQETRKLLESEARKHPDGVIVIPRPSVSDVTYEPFLSREGKPLGIRLKYDVRFSSAGSFSPSPFVFPIYENWEFPGRFEMRVINETIEPLPRVPFEHERPNLLKYDVPAEYEAGITYHFMADLIPDYIIQNAMKTRFCIYSHKFDGSSQAQNMWRFLRSSAMPVRYRVDIRNTDFFGITDDFYPQKTFYDNALGEGAEDCGVNPNVNF